MKTASALQFHILFFLLRGFLLLLIAALLLQKLHLLRDGVLRFGLLLDLGLLRREDFADPIANILQRKQAVKKKTASPKEFSDWLLRQSNIIVELAESKN